MNAKTFLRKMVLSAVPLACAFSMTVGQASAQQLKGFTRAHVQSVVFDGSTQAGWYSFPGQSPMLKFKGNQVRITSREHSTVLLSRDSDTSGSAAEVWLMHPPISTSSISGLAVLSDQNHAMVIGLEGGSVVLWQMDPSVTRIVARHQVNESSPLEFRVTGGDATDIHFFWRHRGDSAWHPLGDSAAKSVLTSWRAPLRFGLLLDGPQGSQVTFSNYRASSDSMEDSSMQAMLVRGQ